MWTTELRIPGKNLASPLRIMPRGKRSGFWGNTIFVMNSFVTVTVELQQIVTLSGLIKNKSTLTYLVVKFPLSMVEFSFHPEPIYANPYPQKRSLEYRRFTPYDYPGRMSLFATALYKTKQSPSSPGRAFSTDFG